MLCSSLQHVRNVLSLSYLHCLSRTNGFQHRTFLSYRVHVLTSRRLSQLNPTLLTAVSILLLNRSCSSLNSLDTDRTENIFPKSSSIVASLSYLTDSVENTASELLHCCLLRVCCSHYLALNVAQLLISRSLPSNGSQY
jgi:hypothetical protein